MATGDGAGGARRPIRVKAVIERGGRYLLALHHNRVPENKGKWTFLGGVMEPEDESPEATLLRELREELAVSGRVEGRVGTFPFREWDCIVLRATFEGEPQPSPTEVLALRWFTPDELAGLAQAHLLHMGFELEAIARCARETP